MIRKIIICAVALILVGAIIGIYLWNKPHRKVEDAQGVLITAEALSKDFNADEKTANQKYLNKAVEVTGVVGEADSNRDGGIMIVLQTTDPMAGIQCTMRDKGVTAVKGRTVTIKGFCSGNGITGVTLTDCVLK